MSRKQCKKCPWRKDVDPRDIPNGYCETKHENLKLTIATPGELRLDGPLPLMACHESMPRKSIVCVGWLDNQRGVGNNLPLRLAIIRGDVSADYELVGEQHEKFEDTLPRDPS